MGEIIPSEMECAFAACYRILSHRNCNGVPVLDRRTRRRPSKIVVRADIVAGNVCFVPCNIVLAIAISVGWTVPVIGCLSNSCLDQGTITRTKRGADSYPFPKPTAVVSINARHCRRRHHRHSDRIGRSVNGGGARRIIETWWLMKNLCWKHCAS